MPISPIRTGTIRGTAILLGAGATFAGARALYKKNSTFRTTCDWTRKQLNRWQFGSEFTVAAIVMGLVPDLASQNSGNKLFSWPRLGSMTFFGGICGALLNRTLYDFLNTRLDNSLSNIIKKTTFTQIVYTPFVFMPIFYAFKSLVLGDFSQDFISDFIQFEKNILPKNWLFWFPTTFAIFRMGEKNDDLRVHAASAFSSIWFSILYSIGLN